MAGDCGWTAKLDKDRNFIFLFRSMRRRERLGRRRVRVLADRVGLRTEWLKSAVNAKSERGDARAKGAGCKICITSELPGIFPESLLSAKISSYKPTSHYQSAQTPHNPISG